MSNKFIFTVQLVIRLLLISAHCSLCPLLTFPRLITVFVLLHLWKQPDSHRENRLAASVSLHFTAVVWERLRATTTLPTPRSVLLIRAITSCCGRASCKTHANPTTEQNMSHKLAPTVLLGKGQTLKAERCPGQLNNKWLDVLIFQI